LAQPPHHHVLQHQLAPTHLLMSAEAARAQSHTHTPAVLCSAMQHS
jgi:hypothetical protein